MQLLAPVLPVTYSHRFRRNQRLWRQQAGVRVDSAAAVGYNTVLNDPRSESSLVLVSQRRYFWFCGLFSSGRQVRPSRVEDNYAPETVRLGGASRLRHAGSRGGAGSGGL